MTAPTSQIVYKALSLPDEDTLGRDSASMCVWGQGDWNWSQDGGIRGCTIRAAMSQEPPLSEHLRCGCSEQPRGA